MKKFSKKGGKKTEVSDNSGSTINLLNLLTLFFFFIFSLLLSWKEKKSVGKLVSFRFPCHHVISMRNICATAKWPVHKTPTLSDVLFSIPLRQNQNNRPAANKNKTTLPISIPDREKLQERRLGREPEGDEFPASLLSQEPPLRQTAPTWMLLMTNNKLWRTTFSSS